MKRKLCLFFLFFLILPSCVEKKANVNVPRASSKKFSIRADQYEKLERKYEYGTDDKYESGYAEPETLAATHQSTAQPSPSFVSPPDLLENARNAKRSALVIGNSKYLHGGSLSNPVNDAKAVSKALENLGFQVFEYENIGQSAMRKAIDDFGKNVGRNDVSLFFYAGHGIQLDGINYLIPSDAKLDTKNDVEYNCVRAGRILGRMEESQSRVNIVILDACRDNPFERSWTRSSKGKGLAFMDAPSGSIIAYATSPGKTASDGVGKNGVYTSALLSHISTPNIAIEEMFKRVRVTVEGMTGKRQIPWESTSLKGNFYFRIEQ